jgi:hypothetical protein
MNAKVPSGRKASPSNPGHVHRLTYANVGPDDEAALFKDRDALAYCEILAALNDIGFKYGTTVYLYPDDDKKLTEFPAFQPSDILVMTTRPPLMDKGHEASPLRKIIPPSNSELEAVLFDELFKYFKWCTRRHVELTDHGAGCLRAEERQKWQKVKLYEYFIAESTFSAAEVQKHYVGPAEVPPEPTHHSSIAFFLRANRLPGINCDFVASFGMNAYSTLIWNRMIRTRFTEWLASPRFMVAELIYKSPLPPRPLTPEFNDNGDYVDIHLLT